MRHEVALIEWREGDGGVRLLGRSTDARVVEYVRRQLRAALGREDEPPPTLRVVDGRLPDNEEPDQ